MGNPANLLREIGLRFKELNRNPNTEIILDIEQDSPDMYIDPEMLTIIINNLASNAVKYTPKGSITFGIHTDTAANGARASACRIPAMESRPRRRPGYSTAIIRREANIRHRAQASVWRW